MFRISNMSEGTAKRGEKGASNLQMRNRPGHFGQRNEAEAGGVIGSVVQHSVPGGLGARPYLGAK